MKTEEKLKEIFGRTYKKHFKGGGSSNLKLKQVTFTRKYTNCYQDSPIPDPGLSVLHA